MQNAALNYCTLYIVFVWSQLDGGKVEQKNNGISSRQNLMMPQLNEWAETSPNPSAKLIQQLCLTRANKEQGVHSLKLLEYISMLLVQRSIIRSEVV